jgi:hypothetical protein
MDPLHEMKYYTLANICSLIERDRHEVEELLQEKYKFCDPELYTFVLLQDFLRIIGEDKKNSKFTNKQLLTRVAID